MIEIGMLNTDIYSDTGLDLRKSIEAVLLESMNTD